MSRIRSKDTSLELVLRRALWRHGLRYRKNDRTVFGCPDLVFRSVRIVVFLDSEFWHGHDYLEGRNIPNKNREFWVNKFEKNITRDNIVNDRLVASGWIIIRVPSRELKDSLDILCDRIWEIVQARKEINANIESRRKHKQEGCVLCFRAGGLAKYRKELSRALQ